MQWSRNALGLSSSTWCGGCTSGKSSRSRRLVGIPQVARGLRSSSKSVEARATAHPLNRFNSSNLGEERRGGILTADPVALGDDTFEPLLVVHHVARVKVSPHHLGGNLA